MKSCRPLTLGLFAVALVSPFFGCANRSPADLVSVTSQATHDMHLMVAPGSLHSDSVTLIWEKPRDNAVRNPTQQIILNGQSIGTAQATHFTARKLSPNTHYTFAVRIDGILSTPVTVDTPAAETIVSVLDHGAVGDGETLNTKAIQSAIDACPQGGIVHIPEGVFLTGALYLKSDMTLEIAKNGVLQGTANPDDYLPFNRNRFEGWEMDTHASLINAGRLDRKGGMNIHNISIRGEGTISGGGRKLYSAVVSQYTNKIDGLRARGRLILLMNAENVEIAGLTIKDSSCWTLHYIYSKDVSIHDLNIQSDVYNGDGIDPDSSVNSYIFNCTFSTGDDCIAIKSGKNPEGNVVNRPTENVRIFDCRFDRGHGISIGSEMSGGVRNVLVEDCVAGNLLQGMQIKATKDRGGFVEDVTVRDCDLQKITIYSSVNYNNDGESAPEQPYFKNFRFENLDLSEGKPNEKIVIVNGFSAPGHRARNIVFENVKLPAGSIVEVDQAEDVRFSNVVTTDRQKPVYKITRSGLVSH